MKADIRLLKLLSDGRFHSGEALSASLSVTRTAIWKKISVLKKTGLDIHAVKGKGYRLAHPLEFLDRETVLSCLPADVYKRIKNFTVLQDTGSTNDYLLQRVNRDSFHAHAVLAEYQTAGRGRRGSRWVSPFGSGICLSVGWHYSEPVESISLVSLAVGVAVIIALQNCGIENAGLKWPNDIYWQDRKLGGILVEMRMESAGPCNTVIGTGLNYILPEKTGNYIDQPWTDIRTIKTPPPSRNSVAATLITEITRMLLKLETQQAKDITRAWRKYDCMVGKKASLVLPDRELNGKVMGIDDDGALLFSEGNMPPRRYHAGEISLRGGI